MKSKSYQKYYEANKESLLVKMRDREAIRREERREFFETNPELMEEERDRLRIKYYTNTSNKIRKAIELLLSSTATSEVFKSLLRSLLENNRYKMMTPKMLETLQMMYASNTPEKPPPAIVDGLAELRASVEDD